MKLKKLVPLPARSPLATCSAPRCASADLRRHDQDRLHHRPVGPVRRHRRPGRRRGDQDGDRRHRRRGRRQEGRGARRRPPEQARRRRRQGARVVRHPGRRHADRRHQLGHQPGHGQGRAGEEEALHLGRRRHRRRSPTSSARPTPCTTPTTRPRSPRAPATPSSRRAARAGTSCTADYAFGTQLQNDATAVVKAAGGSVVGSVRASALGERLLVVPAAGAVEQGADPRPGQRRRRHDQLDQGGQRVRHHQDDEAGRPADVHQRRALARPEGDAGHVPDRQLVLEPRRRVARLEPQVLRQVQAHAVVAAGGGLLGDAAVPERGQGDRQRRRRQGAGADEEDQDQRHLRQGRLDPRRRQHDPRHVPDAGQVAGQVDRALGLLQRRRRPSRARTRGRPRPRASARPGSRRERRAALRRRDGNLRHPDAGLPGPAAARARQRLVLRDAEPRPGGHLRPARHRQLRARRALHDGRVRRLHRRSTSSASTTGRR